MSSWPPIRLAERPYGPARRRRQRGRLKFEATKVSQTQKVEMTYLERACAAQPRGNPSKRCYRAIGPSRHCVRIKNGPENVSQMRNGANAYLGRANALRSIRRPKKQRRRVNKLTFECRMQGERRRDVEDHG